MPWKSIDNGDDLHWLDRAACWEDATTLEVYALGRNESYFPTDVSRSGYINKNLHLFFEIDSPHGDHLHLVLIDCDDYSVDFIENPFFTGRVDTLKRVEVTDYKEVTRMRCSRLIYQFLSLPDHPYGQLYLTEKFAP